MDELFWTVQVKIFYGPKIALGAPRIFIRFLFSEFALEASSSRWGQKFKLALITPCCHRDFNHAAPAESAVRRAYLERQPLRCTLCTQPTKFYRADLQNDPIHNALARLYSTLDAIVFEAVVKEAVEKAVNLLQLTGLRSESSTEAEERETKALAEALTGKIAKIDWDRLEQKILLNR